jgi:RNA polymerase sigma-70 factor (ECF subfamily)
MDHENPIRAELFWVLRAQVGDRAAFDVFLIIYRKIEWLDDPALFRPWLFRIATREALKYRGRQSERREDQFDESLGGSSRQVEKQLSNSVLSGQALRSLEDVPAESRAVLNLHYLEEMSIGETAQVLGIPVGTAKSRLARGIQKLKSLLNERPLKGMVL